MSEMIKLRLGIRVDASPVLGMGHVMRCISIAQALSDIGVESIFICSNAFPSETIALYGFRFQRLSSGGEYNGPEIEELSKAAVSLGLDGLLIDSYSAADEYLSDLQSVLPVVYIDGLYRCKADIAVVINYNAAADLEEYSARFKGTDTRLMIGLAYTPLRREFREGIPRKKIHKEVGSILLTTGAADKYGITNALCRYWKQNDFFPDVEKHIMIGRLFKGTDSLISGFSDDDTYVFHINSTEMRTYMQVADMAISAAGTTVYELLAMQVPSVIFSVAEIQNKVRALEPAIQWAGDLRDQGNTDLLAPDAAERTTGAALSLASSFLAREKMSLMAGKCFDGKGAERLARGIMEAITKC